MQNDNSYQAILQNASLADVLTILFNTEEQVLSQQVDNLDGNEVFKVGIWVERQVIHHSVNSFLWTGGVFYLHQQMTKREDRRDLFDNLTEATGFSRAKAYASIAVFKKFGKLLLIDEPGLIRQFPVGSLRVLAADKASDEARSAAIGRARDEKRIFIHTAEELVELFPGEEDGDEMLPGVGDEPPPDDGAAPAAQKRKCQKPQRRCSAGPKPAATQEQPFWSFPGRATKVVIQLKSKRSPSDPVTIHADILAAADAYLHEQIEAANADAQPEGVNTDV